MSTRSVAVDGALALGSLAGLVGLYGLLTWYLARPSRAFWLALRGAQLAALAYAAFAGIVSLGHHGPSGDIFYLYALLPLAVGFVAEQLRLAAADQVLAARDLDDARDVGKLEVAEQQAIVIAILRREMGVMAAASLVVCFLALRAAGTY